MQAPSDGHRLDQLGVPVAGHDLAGRGLDAQSQLLAHVRLDGRVDQRVRADRARHGAHGDGLAGGGQPLQGPVDGEGEAGQLVAERGGLGVHAVGAAHHHRVPVLEGPVDQHLAQPLGGGGEHVGGAGQGEAEGRVHQVVAGHAQVHPASGGLRHALAVGGQEGEHLVVAFLLDLHDPGRQRGRGRAHVVEDRGRYAAEPHLCLGREDLHADPGLVPVLVREEVRHLRQGETRNHGTASSVAVWAGRAVRGRSWSGLPGVRRPRSTRAAPTR